MRVEIFSGAIVKLGMRMNGIVADNYKLHDNRAIQARVASTIVDHVP